MNEKYSNCPRIKGIPIVDYVRKLAHLLCTSEGVKERQVGTDLLFICADLKQVNFDIDKLKPDEQTLFLLAFDFACEKLDMTEERAATEYHDKYQQDFETTESEAGILGNPSAYKAYRRFIQQERHSRHQQTHQ